MFIDLYEKRLELQNMVDELNLVNAMLSIRTDQLKHAKVALSSRTMLLETSSKLDQQITSILDAKELFTR